MEHNAGMLTSLDVSCVAARGRDGLAARVRSSSGGNALPLFGKCLQQAAEHRLSNPVIGARRQDFRRQGTGDYALAHRLLHSRV
jgi:hypothetical protein